MIPATKKRITSLFIRPIKCYTTIQLPHHLRANLPAFAAHYRPAFMWVMASLVGMTAWVSMFIQNYTLLNVIGAILTVPIGLYVAFIAVSRQYIIVSHDSYIGVIFGILLVGLFASMIWPPVQLLRQGYFLLLRWHEWRKGEHYVLAHTHQPVRMA